MSNSVQVSTADNANLPYLKAALKLKKLLDDTNIHHFAKSNDNVAWRIIWNPTVNAFDIVNVSTIAGGYSLLQFEQRSIALEVIAALGDDLKILFLI